MTATTGYPTGPVNPERITKQNHRLEYPDTMHPRDSDHRAETRRLIVNPTSGNGDHVDHVRQLAGEYGFTVRETEHAEHGIELAESAAKEGVDLLGVCGGDGTVHEVVQGLVAADALDSVTLTIVPAGTANIVASELGISSIRDAFDVAVSGQTRQLDLGMAAGEPFVMSAIAGLPADTSAAASSEQKERFGTFAFVIEGIQETRQFDGLNIEVEATSRDRDFVWTGDVLTLLIENLRGFYGADYANAKDGLLDVTIVEQMPASEAVLESIEQRLLDGETQHISRLTAARIRITGPDDTAVTFSLDGEIRNYESVEISVLPGALNVRVDESYTSDSGGLLSDQ